MANATASYLATKIELQGPFYFLFHNPFPEVGFLQAYFLAALVGMTLIIGARTEKFYLFDLVGLTMHLIPPLALILMYKQIQSVMGQSTIYLSISIHATFVTLELIALAFYFKGDQSNDATK